MNKNIEKSKRANIRFPTIRVSQLVKKNLISIKKEDESFSEVVKRLYDFYKRHRPRNFDNWEWEDVEDPLYPANNKKSNEPTLRRKVRKFEDDDFEYPDFLTED